MIIPVVRQNNCNISILNCGQGDPATGVAGDWFIDESNLARLWDDVFQRIIVYYWCMLEYERDPSGLANHGVILCQDMITVAHDSNINGGALVGVDSATISRSPVQQMPLPPFQESDVNYCWWYLLKMIEVMEADVNVSPLFRSESLRPLMDYYFNSPNTAIPIIFLNGSAYDYILSSDGLELIVPEPMAIENNHDENIFRRRVFELYSTRLTAQYPILIPPLVDTAQIGFVCEDPSLIRRQTVRMISNDNNVEEIQYTLFNMLQHAGWSNILINGAPMSDAIEVLRVLIMGDQGTNFDDLSCNNYAYDFSGSNFRHVSDAIRAFLCLLSCSPLSLEAYLYLRSQTRCWQLSGSVFRRISNLVPRLIAEMWKERQLSDILSNVAVAALGGQHRVQIDTLATQHVRSTENRYLLNSDAGCRQLFGERLEISLPGNNRMSFRGLRDDEYPNHGFNGNEVVIHASGITLPRIGPPPDRAYLYHTWKSGLAANPVFTDSSKCS